MKFLFVCGGTAGHIKPALAIAGTLRDRMPDAEFLFVGSGRELENRLIPQAGFEIVNISSAGFSRGKSLKSLAANAKSAAKLARGSVQARKIINSFEPDAAIGTGGYVCYPVLRCAAKKGIPTVVHESNALPGMTIKMLSPLVDRVMVAFPDMEKLYKRPDRVIMTGTPVRSGFSTLTKEQAKEKLGLSGRPVVVSFWGSLGADHMNDVMADMIAENAREDAFYHIHATGGGEKGLAAMRNRLSERGVKSLPEHLDLRPYIDDMPMVMTASDVVLCRAGASTLGELTAIGKPAILVPSPYVVDNHQEKNASALDRAGGAVMIKEPDCTGKLLFDAVKKLTADEKKLVEMSENLKRMGSADSAERIADIILSLCK